MSVNKRRLAGYRLAAVPIDDVSEQLRTAYDALTQRQSPSASAATAPGFLGGTFKVPGTGGVQVDLSARKTDRAVPFVGDEDVVFGNAEQLQPMLDPSSPGEYNLVWNVMGGRGELSRPQQVRVAREAARQWPEIIKQIPEGAIVSNSPVGALHGDYERADLYTRYGFGPVQEDGQQFGVVRGGHIEPLSPFIADKGHAQHLAQRLAATGDTSLQDAIAAELTRRKETGIEDRLAEAQARGQYNPAYDDDYDYYDDDGYYEEPLLTREDLKRQIISSVEPETNQFSNSFGSITSIPEIEARRTAESQLQYAPNGSYEPTGTDIEALRQFQIQQLQHPTHSRDVVDFINSVSPRPLPQRIGVEDLANTRPDFRIGDRFGRGHTTFTEYIQQLPPEQRRDAVATALRDRLSAHSQGYDSDPSVLRNEAKRALVSRSTNPTGLGVIAQENFSADDIENFRELQRLQQLAFPVEAPLRTPPPTLNPDGSVASRRPAPDSVVQDANTHINAYNPYPDLIDGTTVEWRRQLSPDQQRAADQIPGVAAAPAQIRRDITRLDDWLGGSTPSSRIARDIYGADSVQSLLNSQQIDTNVTPNLARDLRTLERSISQPGSQISNREVAQAIYNLQQLEPQQQQILQSLQNVVAPAAYGPATQVRRGPDTRPPRVETDDRSDLFSRSSRGGRGGRRSGARGGLESLQERDYSRAPADMSISEFLEWERQNDNISNYSLTPEQRYEQRTGAQSAQSNNLQAAFDATPLASFVSDSAPSPAPAQPSTSRTTAVRVPAGTTPDLGDLLDAGVLSSTAPSATSSIALERGRRSEPTERRRGSRAPAPGPNWNRRSPSQRQARGRSSEVVVDGTPTQFELPLF